jgi:hypothetical protein
MLEHAAGLRVDAVEGDGGRRWEVIVEPDEEIRLLVVVAAYPVS